MRTNISLPEEDMCEFCVVDDTCPKNKYDCPILAEAIHKKQAIYVWCWIPKPDKKKK